MSISRLIDGDLSEHECAQVRRHLESCVTCARLYGEMCEAREVVRAFSRQELSTSLWPAVRRGLHEQPVSVWCSFYQLARAITPLMAGLAAVVVFFITLGFVSGEGSRLRSCRQDHLIIEQDRITHRDILSSLAEISRVGMDED
ncbi:MAG: zf-HC2 domain-containing protein [Acidobacteria bacterium]|nr:zf-HC2 domain-containing protein [Acidobacteriota bacterium]